MSGVDQFELVLGLLAIAVVFSAVAQWVRLPPAVAFVLGGMLLAVIPATPSVEIDPDLIMLLFLPPLLHAGAYSTVWRDFRAQLVPILMLAVGAVAFTTFVVGWIAKLVLPDLPWAACFTLGAIVSPPDAVSAKAVLQRLRLPRRVVTILEGESLINDASGLVLYRFAVAAALAGTFSAGNAAVTFIWLAVGGVSVGVAFGYMIIFAYRRMRDPDRMILLSFLVSYGGYVAAERLHVSGVLAVVSLGLIMGWHQHETLTAHTRTKALAVWQIVVFALEALVFVLIGLSLRGVLSRLGTVDAALVTGIPLTLAVTVAAVLSRFAWVYPAVYLTRLLPARRARNPVPALAVPLIISWAGMRGVVSLAAALALPEKFPGRDVILLATFGVILATVLLQGATLGPLVLRLRLQVAAENPQTMSEDAARAHIFAASAAWLETLTDATTGAIAHPRLLEDYRARARATTRFLADVEALLPTRHLHFDTALKTVAHARAELIKLHRAGRIHDSVLNAVEAELDLEELRLRMLDGVGGHVH